jgi:hypothetical protein
MTRWILFLIFILAVAVRLVNFHESLYFGYDEARDAFDSQNIYLKGDLKISGPPASAFRGINHGPVYLYFIGPLFLLGGGNPYFVSIVFRLINALGIFLLFWLVSIYFDKKTALISALLFALSFEQYQYAIFTGNPSLSNVFWIVLFLGAGLVYKYEEKKKLGLFLMFLGASSIAQFDLILSYSFLTLILLLFLLKRSLKGIKFLDWLKIVLLGLIPIYSYPIAEIKNNFLGIKTLMAAVLDRTSILSNGQSVGNVFLSNFAGLFNDNVFKFNSSLGISAFLLVGIVLFLLYRAKKNYLSYFVIAWIFSLFFLLPTRGFVPYYSYAGVGIGVIVGASVLLAWFYKKSSLLFLAVLILIAFSNLSRVYLQSRRGLIVDIKAQPQMLLSDEIKIIKRTYEYAAGRGFTIRVTSMPYKIQTVWAYLYGQYGYKNYHYWPYLETGNILGYPGVLPVPKSGTTCVRFLIREPVRGIPEILIENDKREENQLSKLIQEEKIGDFVLQIREALDKNCHSQKGQL